MQTVEPNPGTRNQNRTNQLNKKLRLIAHSYQIVGDTLHIENHQGRQPKCQMYAMYSKSNAETGRHNQCEQAYHQSQRDGDDRCKSHSSQTRHHTLMHLSLIEIVEKLLPIGDQDDFRYNKCRQNGTHQEGK